MEALIIPFLAFCIFVAVSPKETTQLVLAASWAVMVLMALGAIVYAVGRMIFG